MSTKRSPWFGKWHLGDEPEHYPTNQGFDEAEWSEGNPPWWGFHRGVKRTDSAGYVNMGAFAWGPGPENFPYDTGGIMRAKRGEKPKIVAHLERQQTGTAQASGQ